MSNQARFMQNIAILAQLKNGHFNPAILKQYSGWGGLRHAIYNPAVYNQLKKILTPEEIISIKQTLKNAYYTPAKIVSFVYDWLLIYGFKGGHILEPSVGNGVFIECMPKKIKNNSQITAVELDKITSDITQKLYPDISLYNCPFENYQPANKFDLIIGNPPYGANTVIDPQHSDLNDYCIHHYFAAKSMRLLKQGGILAMVLPSYFLDNLSKHTRNIIHKEGGNLISAYRLPDNIFSGAKVTIDIVFLMKGETGKKWLNTKDVTISGITKPINEFYYNNNHHILGNLEIVDMYERKGLTCRTLGNPYLSLENAISNFKQAQYAQKWQLHVKQKMAEIDFKIAELNAAKQALLAKNTRG